jgi:hypothetical protein
MQPTRSTRSNLDTELGGSGWVDKAIEIFVAVHEAIEI